MRRGDNGLALVALAVAGGILLISKMAGVPWTVAIDSFVPIVIWLAAFWGALHYGLMPISWPCFVAGAVIALDKILSYKFAGSWLGEPSGQNTLAILLLIAGYLFEWRRQPRYR